MLDFDKLEQAYQASKKGDVPRPLTPEIDVDALEREYQMSRPLSEQNPKASFQDYSDTRDAEMVGEPRPGDTVGSAAQAAVVDKLRDIGTTGVFLATSALEGAVHPLFAPLEGTPFDTNKLIADAVEYWRARTPAGFAVHDLGVTVSKKPVKGEIAAIGPVRLVPVKYSARELAGQVAEGTGFAVPAGTAMTAGRLVSRAAGLTGTAERIAGGVIGGALLGEGNPKKTAETAAMFGLFEAIPALGSVIKNKVQRAKLMREWRRLPEEQKVPVMQSMAETLRKNPKMSEAEAVRMSQEWFKEAQQKRIANGQATLKAEQGAAKENFRTAQQPRTTTLSTDALEEVYQKSKSTGKEEPPVENINETASGGIKPQSSEKAYRAKEGVDPIKIQHIVELPEVIELTRGFMNKDPRIVQRFRDFGVLGSFRPGKAPEIKLRRDLAENPELAARVLAHELGHAEDFNFETMSRGNLLGRIAKLRVYLKKQLAEKPGAPGPLTEAEKAVLREEARKIRQQEIDKAIGDELGFIPEEVLNFLRGVNADDLPKEVKDFIAKADTPTKKSIVKQAMKGLPPEELAQFKKTPHNIGKSVEEHFKELLKKEVERRRLWELEEIKEELRNFSKQWRPWDEGQDAGYDEYRNSPEELYADAVSGVILAPDSLQQIAPKFYKAFENYLETRPKFAENYQKIMERITAGPEEVSRHRIKQTYKDFAAEAEKAKEREKTRLELKKKEEEKTVDTLLRGLNTSDHPILKFVKVAEKGDVLGKRKARLIREMLLKRPYTPSEIDAYAYDFKQWYDAVHESGLTVDDLGALGKRLHIVYNRKNIFSSHGLTPKTAAKDIAVLARDWGPEKYNKARKFLNKYRKLREKHIIPLLRKSGLITPDMAETIKRRGFYLRVLSQDWLRADQWSGMKQFYRQVGTISSQQNPIVSTFLDDIAAIYASRENILRRAVYRFMTEIGAGRKAEMKYSSTEKRMVVNKRALKHREKVARVKVDGKYRYYFMLDNIVDALEKDSFKQYQMLRLWQTMGQIFRELYVGSNPQWMLRNMPRDFLETVFKNPDVVGLKGIGKLLKAYWETAPDVFKEAWHNERSALIQDMMRRRTLPTNRIWGSFEETPANEIERTLSRYNLYKLTDSQKKLYNKFVRRFFENQKAEQIADEIEAFARAVWDKKERFGRASDLWGKVAARKFFEKYTDLPRNEIDMRVIEQAGTPNYKNRGAWQIITNNLFMFSTVAKEGLKADIRALRRSPLAWLSTMATLTILPAVMNWMADEGHMGKEIKRIFNRIPKYYKDHYFVIPLFVDNNGKAHFLAFPTGYNQQVLKATFSKLLRGEFGGAGGAISETTGLSPYSVHPLIGKLTAFALYYLYGVNPPNLHYGTNIISPSDYDVGGKAAAKDLFRDAWNDLTGGWLYRAKGPYESQRKSKAEKFLTRFPGNILGTFYKISDGGIGERIRDRLAEMRKEAKKRNLSVREYRLKIAKDRDAAIAAAQALRRIGDKRQARELEKDIARLWGDQWAKAVATAKNDEEREAILQLMMEDDQ